MHTYDVLTTDFRCNIYPRILICFSLFYNLYRVAKIALFIAKGPAFVFQITAVVISVERYSMHGVNCFGFLAERMKLHWSLFIKQFLSCCGAHGNENVPCTQTRNRTSWKRPINLTVSCYILINVDPPWIIENGLKCLKRYAKFHLGIIIAGNQSFLL